VAGSHVLVEGVDSRSTGHLTVLLVHVVSAGAGVVTDPDSEVLDLGGALLVDLSHTQISHQFLPSCAIAELKGVHTSLSDTISPADFLTLRSFFKKYQKRDLATTVLLAKRRIR
jgi:hypothetical protein